jgi:hypothetical protein
MKGSYHTMYFLFQKVLSEGEWGKKGGLMFLKKPRVRVFQLSVGSLEPLPKTSGSHEIFSKLVGRFPGCPVGHDPTAQHLLTSN